MTLSIARAAALRDQVKTHWNPPRDQKDATLADCVGTSVMQTLAWVCGRDFLGELTESQQAALDSGLVVFERHFGSRYDVVVLRGNLPVRCIPVGGTKSEVVDFAVGYCRGKLHCERLAPLPTDVTYWRGAFEQDQPVTLPLKSPLTVCIVPSEAKAGGP